MFGLSSLFPLETLPGWPTAIDPTVVEALFLLVGIPGMIGLVIAALVIGPSRLSRGATRDDATA